MPATSHTIDTRTSALEHDRRGFIDDVRRLLLASRDEQTTILDELTAGAGTDALDEHAEVSAAFARNLLEDVEEALARIDDGSYGTCASCGEPIGLERLRALPQSQSCIACAPTAPHLSLFANRSMNGPCCTQATSRVSTIGVSQYLAWCDRRCLLLFTGAGAPPPARSYADASRRLRTVAFVRHGRRRVLVSPAELPGPALSVTVLPTG